MYVYKYVSTFCDRVHRININDVVYLRAYSALRSRWRPVRFTRNFFAKMINLGQTHAVLCGCLLPKRAVGQVLFKIFRDYRTSKIPLDSSQRQLLTSMRANSRFSVK